MMIGLALALFLGVAFVPSDCYSVLTGGKGGSVILNGVTFSLPSPDLSIILVLFGPLSSFLVEHSRSFTGSAGFEGLLICICFLFDSLFYKLLFFDSLYSREKS